MTKAKRFDQILLKNYIYLIILCALMIGLLSAFFDIRHTMRSEKGIIAESLEQAQLNLDRHIEMVEDYLSLTHANATIQQSIISKDNSSTGIVARTAVMNSTLFSIDPFKKSIDSMHLFAFDSEGIYPDFGIGTMYSNAVFSSSRVSDREWFLNTLANNGRTYWFIDMDSEAEPTVCAARILFSTSAPSQRLGVIKATMSLDKFCSHLSKISFGNKGDTYLSAGEQIFSASQSGKTYPLVSLDDLPAADSHLHLRLERPLESGWKIIGIIPFQELYRNVFQNLLLIVLAVVTAAVTASFVSLRISKKISFPIQELCRNMSALKPLPTVPDDNCIEINQLCGTYQSMLIEMEQLIKTREETAMKLKQAELSALQSQINPHFIYNTLESINALVATGSSDDASSMITGLSTFLRSSLNNGNTLISLKQEIQQAVSYFQIQQFRFSNRITLELDLPEQIPECRIIKLILQPFIENCIVHGFKDIDYIGVILLSLQETDNELIIKIADNGLGSDIEMLNYLLKQRTLYRDDNVNFYCIQNVYQRLQNCYGQHFALYYEENDQGGVTVCISIEKMALKIVRS